MSSSLPAHCSFLLSQLRESHHMCSSPGYPKCREGALWRCTGGCIYGMGEEFVPLAAPH